MRKEKDSLGELKVPEEVYYGIQTLRASHNFPISRQTLPRRFIKAQAVVKLASARANEALGLLDRKKTRAIARASREVMEGRHDHHFIVDVFQAGAGTSQNMNANEVIANRAIELLGGRRGDYSVVHPNDHVNMAQSTNDTIPSSMYIAVHEALREDLEPALASMRRRLLEKSRAFRSVVKSGRTHLQDAVPISLGQEFSGYAAAVKKDIVRVRVAAKSLMDLPIGGNATGTGINAHRQFKGRVISEIRRLTGVQFRSAINLFEAIQNVSPAVEVSASLRSLSITLTKITNDIRLLSSGPRTGLAELRLPAVQPGSSIMPGKVNPVMAEMLNMVCFQVMGYDVAIAYAAQASQLELNVMMPLIAHNLLSSIEILSKGIEAFTEKCLAGIRANKDVCNQYAEASLAMATALNPVIGYAAAAEVSKEAYLTGKSVRQVVIEKGILSEKDADRLLDPRRLTGS